MKNLQKRTITGALFAGTIIGMTAAGPMTFGILLFIISAWSILEFYSLFTTRNVYPQKFFGIAISQLFIILMILVARNAIPVKWLLVMIPLLFSVFFAELFRKKEHPFLNIAITLTGLIYITIPISLFGLMIFNVNLIGDFNSHLALGIFFLHWANDTGAYLIGSRFGKRKLFKRHSPNKTWEGSAGGALAALLVAYALGSGFKEMDMIHWMAVAVIIVITGTLGDLAESMLKRSLQLKDTGTIFPGHGGMLDRFDGLLISLPFIAFYLFFCHVI
jgi:phosphatidate cytidylyltransferase